MLKINRIPYKTSIRKFDVNDEMMAITNGTSFRDNVEIGYEQLVDLFGEENERYDHKVDCEWIVLTPYGIATIYNWKNGKNYCDDKGLDKKEIENWHIGGHNEMASNFLVEIIKEKSKK